MLIVHKSERDMLKKECRDAAVARADKEFATCSDMRGLLAGDLSLMATACDAMAEECRKLREGLNLAKDMLTDATWHCDKKFRSDLNWSIKKLETLLAAKGGEDGK